MPNNEENSIRISQFTKPDFAEIQLLTSDPQGHEGIAKEMWYILLFTTSNCASRVSTQTGRRTDKTFA